MTQTQELQPAQQQNRPGSEAEMIRAFLNGHKRRSTNAYTNLKASKAWEKKK